MLGAHGPIADAHVTVSLRSRVDGDQFLQPRNASTDAEGRFVIDGVFPGVVELQRLIPIAGDRFIASGHTTRLQVASGETADVQIGGDGVIANGRMRLPEGLEAFSNSCRVTKPPADDGGMPAAASSTSLCDRPSRGRRDRIGDQFQWRQRSRPPSYPRAPLRLTG